MFIYFKVDLSLFVLCWMIDLYLIVNELFVLVYDMFGLYLDLSVMINVEKGFVCLCIEWVKDCGYVEEYVGCDVKLEDNGGVKGKYFVCEFLIKYIFLCGIGDGLLI